jgi:CheY-like chemotaxis protein
MLPHVLLVDDEPMIVRGLQVHLERAGFEVSGANNGQQALQRLAEEANIDVIITDVMMPVMDGFELLSKVRQQPDLSSVPAIILGPLSNEVRPGLTMEDKWQEARSAYQAIGADEFVPKPCHPAELVQAVHAVLSRR